MFKNSFSGRLLTRNRIDSCGIWSPIVAVFSFRIDDGYSVEKYLAILKHEAISYGSGMLLASRRLIENAMSLGFESTEEGIIEFRQCKQLILETVDEFLREVRSNDTKNSELLVDLLCRHFGTKPCMKWLGITPPQIL